MCDACSKIRCKIYRIASGDKTVRFSESCGTYCYSGTYPLNDLQLGSDWKSFPSFVKKTVKAFKQRKEKKAA